MAANRQLEDLFAVGNERYQQFQRSQLVKDLERLLISLNKIDQLFEKFKQNFYPSFADATFINQVETLHNEIKLLQQNALGIDQEIDQDLQKVCQQTLQQLNDLIENQSQLSEACYTNYVVPLVDRFWNFKFQMEMHLNRLKFPAKNNALASEDQNAAVSLEMNLPELLDCLDLMTAKEYAFCSKNTYSNVEKYLSRNDNSSYQLFKKAFQKDAMSSLLRNQIKFLQSIVPTKDENNNFFEKVIPLTAIFAAISLIGIGILMFNTITITDTDLINELCKKYFPKMADEEVSYDCCDDSCCEGSYFDPKPDLMKACNTKDNASIFWSSTLASFTLIFGLVVTCMMICQEQLHRVTEEKIDFDALRALGLDEKRILNSSYKKLEAYLRSKSKQLHSLEASIEKASFYRQSCLQLFKSQIKSEHVIDIQDEVPNTKNCFNGIRKLFSR